MLHPSESVLRRRKAIAARCYIFQREATIGTGPGGVTACRARATSDKDNADMIDGLLVVGAKDDAFNLAVPLLERGATHQQRDQQEGGGSHDVFTIMPAISFSSLAATTAVMLEMSQRGLYSTMSAPTMG